MMTWYSILIASTYLLLQGAAQPGAGKDLKAHHPRHGWTYNDLTKWGRTYPNCNGKHQSPINIDFSKTVQRSYNEFNFINYDEFPPIETLQDNGHTLEASQNENFRAFVTGGGLPGLFRLKQFHLHWGSDNEKGSEHTVDGERFPLEMHMVHYNTKYGDPKNASLHEDGLVVLGVLFHVEEVDNPAMQPFIAHATGLVNTQQTASVRDGVPFRSMLPQDVSQYYRYTGSLTTPGCNQAVTWTIFRHSVGISDRQLQVLRHLNDASGHHLENNYRPTQPLNDREVFRSFHTGSELVKLLQSFVNRFQRPLPQQSFYYYY